MNTVSDKIEFAKTIKCMDVKESAYGVTCRIKDTPIYYLFANDGFYCYWVKTFSCDGILRSTDTLFFTSFEDVWDIIPNDAKIELAYHLDFLK